MPDSRNTPGISGMAVYVPAYRIALEDWCHWYGHDWGKVANVVGHSFRMPRAEEDVYCLAATAVLQLIRQYDIDPQQVGMLALGTESSKDNATGAVIVRGMVDEALHQLGQAPLARDCEVPEYKHACLGGMYALKGALRYLSTDAQDNQIAIVVAADIAEYARGSSGEQTQGAGAVAMLVDHQAHLFRVDLAQTGVASAYRGPDFRKPTGRHFHPDYTVACQRHHDFPVFSGRYSTFAYMDQTLCAMRSLWQRGKLDPARSLEQVDGLFFHRPYAHMPIQGLAMIYIDALHQSGRLSELHNVAIEKNIDLRQVSAELNQQPDLFNAVQTDDKSSAYTTTSSLAAALRRSSFFKQFQQQQLNYGVALTKELGNLYTAALPAWIAAGLEDALTRGDDLAGRTFWAIGYGSGDAAEAMPFQISDQWRPAARRIGFQQALADAVDLTQAQYEALHDHGQQPLTHSAAAPPPVFRIDRFGQRLEADFQDLGVPYYGFCPAALPRIAA